MFEDFLFPTFCPALAILAIIGARLEIMLRFWFSALVEATLRLAFADGAGVDVGVIVDVVVDVGQLSPQSNSSSSEAAAARMKMAALSSSDSSVLV